VRTIELAIWGPIARRDLAGLCARVCELLEAEGPAIAICDVSSVAADAVAVDALGFKSPQAGGVVRCDCGAAAGSCGSSSRSWGCGTCWWRPIRLRKDGVALHGEASVEGDWVDRVIGLEGVRSEVAMLQTPDRHGRVELAEKIG